MHKSINFLATILTKCLLLRFSSFSLKNNSLIWGWRIRGEKNITLTIGENSIVKSNIYFEKSDGVLKIGNRTFIGKGLISITKLVEIGDDVMISWGVTITDHNSHSLNFTKRSKDILSWKLGEKDWSNVKIEAVKIEDKAWIGFNSILLKGVCVGEGAIIGAGSVVTRNVPPWTIVAGNPAKVIREIPVNER